MTVSELARQLGCEVHGDGGRTITGVSGMEQAGPEHVTFLANPKYAPKVKDCRAGAILTAAPIDGELHHWFQPTRIWISRVRWPFFTSRLVPNRAFTNSRSLPLLQPSATMPRSGRLPSSDRDHASEEMQFCTRMWSFMKAREIGDDFLAHSHASVREFCRIGHRVTLQNGVVVGGDGFGFAKRADGSHEKIVQSGVTVIEDDVEIQSLTSVDRATMGETRVRRGARIDSLVQIGHACVVGEDNIICAQTGLAGSTVLEKNVLLAGQVGVSGHLTIHENAIVYAQSGVGGDVPAGSRISGSPAFDSREWLRAVTAFPKIAEMQRLVRQLEKRVHQLESRASQGSDER